MSAFFMKYPAANFRRFRRFSLRQTKAIPSRTKFVPKSYQVRSIFELLDSNKIRIRNDFG